MLKDIEFRKVEDMALAIVPETVAGEELWTAYLINTGRDRLQSVIVRSNGYGEVDGRHVGTSELRQYIETLGPESYIRIEEIRDELFPLNNQFWISFSRANYLFDKKYVFVPETLQRDNLVRVPLLDKPGVLIQ